MLMLNLQQLKVIICRTRTIAHPCMSNIAQRKNPKLIYCEKPLCNYIYTNIYVCNDKWA